MNNHTPLAATPLRAQQPSPFARGALAYLALAMAATTAQAAASNDDLQRVKLYGQVSIAEDTTDSWGPWNSFEAPAAGPGASLASPVGANPEFYRPLPQTTTPQVPAATGLGCLGGGLCGFGAIEGETSTNAGYSSLVPTAVLFTGKVEVPDTQIPLLPQAITLNAQALGQGAPVVFADTGVLNRRLMDGEGSPGVSYKRLAQTESPTGPHTELFELSGYAYQQGHNAEATQVAQAQLYAGISDYVRGSDGESMTYNSQTRSGPVVIGYATSDTDLSALRASNASAAYFGYGSDSNSQVRLEVQFGAGTWQGSWNGGADGQVYTSDAQLRGQVGFTAAGTINGANIVSTSVGTTDAGASVSGFVRGAFFGPQAAAAAGVVDITKTNPNAMVQADRALAQPAAIAPRVVVEGGGYSNARHTDTFLTTRTGGEK